jgi:hypothetical protein
VLSVASVVNLPPIVNNLDSTPLEPQSRG